MENKGKGEEDDAEITKMTRTKWKWRHSGHYVVSVVPDILSGGACSLHVPGCHSGHTSSLQGSRMSNFKPH